MPQNNFLGLFVFIIITFLFSSVLGRKSTSLFGVESQISQETSFENPQNEKRIVKSETWPTTSTSASCVFAPSWTTSTASTWWSSTSRPSTPSHSHSFIESWGRRPWCWSCWPPSASSRAVTTSSSLPSTSSNRLTLSNWILNLGFNKVQLSTSSKRSKN